MCDQNEGVNQERERHGNPEHRVQPTLNRQRGPLGGGWNFPQQWRSRSGEQRTQIRASQKIPGRISPFLSLVISFLKNILRLPYLFEKKNCNTFVEVSVQFSSVTQLCPTLCDPMNCSTPGLPVHHQLPEFTQTHVHRVRDAIQPSHPRSSPCPPAPNPSQHQSLFQ